jgi:Cu/Zn superoxide dismutase
MKRTLTFALPIFLFTILAATLIGCKKNDDTTNTDKVIKNGILLQTTQETGTINSSASGTIDIDYTKSTKMLMFTVKWNGLTGNATAMHFHGPAARGATASPVIGITGFPQTSNGSFSDMKTLTADQEADFLAGKWYYNIHTPTYGGGEIRGQIEF